VHPPPTTATPPSRRTSAWSWTTLPKVIHWPGPWTRSSIGCRQC
jgi:hypothetical protein